MTILDIYKNHIYNRYKDLLNAKKIEDLDNNDLCKIFEYLSCIKLSEEYETLFYEYGDIDPEFKELNQMTRNDTGIDCSNLIDTIVQCKLRKDTLNWKECATFFGSQNLFNEELNETIVRWKKLIITRNSECKLSTNLQEKKRLFIDKTYSRDDIIKYCERLLETPPIIPIVNQIKKDLRDYQQECKDLICNSKENVIISLPTGTGKNFIIIHSLEPKKKYLILVPRIILMEQIKDEIINYNSKLKNKIQLIGDSKNVFVENKDITICVYNSVKIVEEHSSKFYKIFIDEAHHISKPEIYCNDEQDLEQDLENPARKDDDEYVDSDIEYSDDEQDLEQDLENPARKDDDEYYDSDLENEDEEQDLENPARKNSENEEDEDNDDEIKDETTYIDIIQNFTKLNNNVYLSATIDPQDKFLYYEKNLREMIDKKYLCDYTINIPIFTDDPTNKNICEYLLKEYRNIIIYCNTKKEGKQINKLMNELQNKSSEYIDCDTTKTKRNKILKEYKDGNIPFLVNVRILVEGFDAPITKGVCFMHLPSSKTTLIQIIGRALRLHDMKIIANIILPFSSKEDESSITNFMKVMAKNDSRIKKSLESKKVGGYISLVKVGEKVEDDNVDDEEEDEELRDINFKYELVFDSICIMKNSEEIWIKRLEECKKYIDENKEKPSRSSKIIDIKKMGQWIGQNNHKYFNKIYIMKDETIYKLWYEFINDEKYKQYFLSQYDSFVVNLNKIKTYIDTHNQRPSASSKDKDIKKMGIWISYQKQNYIKKKENMKDKKIRKIWEEFINDANYKKYFLSQYDSFIFKLNKVKTYIDTNNQRPSNSIQDKDIKSIAQWLGQCQINYVKNIKKMNNKNIKKLWEQFINDKKYKVYMQLPTMLEIFNINLNKVKSYIDTNKKRPSDGSKNKNIKSIGQWIGTCQKNYNKKIKNMKDETIRKLWEEFINDVKYKEYFLSQYDNFVLNLNKVKEYIDTNKKRPSGCNKDKDIKSMGTWISNSQKNYAKKINNMKDETIKKLWENFINDDKYKENFN
jgi:superfamily II DNA or RNA helicase